MAVPTFTSQRRVAVAAPVFDNTPTPTGLTRFGNKALNTGLQIKDEEQRNADNQWVSEAASVFRRNELALYQERAKEN